MDSKLFYDYVAQYHESRAKAVPEVVKLQEEVYWNLKEFCIGLINILENIALQWNFLMGFSLYPLNWKWEERKDISLLSNRLDSKPSLEKLSIRFCIF